MIKSSTANTSHPANARIVIIDDEAPIRRMLKIALHSAGYQVVEADNAATGLAAISRQQPDLVILDLGLPDQSGHDLLQELRDWSQVPVIILSVRDRESDKVLALDKGAQDYVTKPFSMEELLARIRANLRDRQHPALAYLFDDGFLQIDLSKRQVCREQIRLEFTLKEYAVLSKLVRNPNCVITQKQLLEEIWGPHHQQDSHYLRIVISHLRQKIGDDPAEPRYIKTDPGVGYRFMYNEACIKTSY